jgi:hypothetical protein
MAIEGWLEKNGRLNLLGVATVGGGRSRASGDLAFLVA